VAGEEWRLFTLNTNIDGKQIKIMTGQILNASYLLIEEPLTPQLDVALLQEADKIASQLENKLNKIVLKDNAGIKSRADAYLIIDAFTGEIFDMNGGIPQYFPEDKKIFYEKKSEIFIDKTGILYLVRSDYNDTLQVTTLSNVGNLKILLLLLFLIFIIIFSIGDFLGNTIFKKMFLFYGKYPISLEQALKSCEGQAIEFKRGIIDDDILKSITAFSNTNDGTIFIGVDDSGHIEDQRLNNPKDKERLVHKITSLVKNHIKPLSFFTIDFVSLRNCTIARLFVPRGEEPLYYLDGIIYVRHQDSDRKAEPDIVKNILIHYI
jgi:hypothetical protein